MYDDTMLFQFDANFYVVARARVEEKLDFFIYARVFPIQKCWSILAKCKISVEHEDKLKYRTWWKKKKKGKMIKYWEELRDGKFR